MAATLDLNHSNSLDSDDMTLDDLWSALDQETSSTSSVSTPLEEFDFSEFVDDDFDEAPPKVAMMSPESDVKSEVSESRGVYPISPDTDNCGLTAAPDSIQNSVTDLKSDVISPTNQESVPSGSLTNQHAVPSSSPYSGQYGFEIGFQQQYNETKATTWIYSEKLRKLFVKMGAACPIRFKTTSAPPKGAIIRAMPVYINAGSINEVVKRCPNHSTGQETNENHPAPTHLVRCEHPLAKYIEDPVTRRLIVLVPRESPQPGTEWVTALYQFMCFSSCVGGLNRRPLRVVFTLENIDGEVLGRQSVELRICACPGRDLRVEEQALALPTPQGQQQILRQKRQAPWGKPGGEGCEKQRKIDGREEFTLTVTGLENYEILCKIRDSLEMAATIMENINTPVSLCPAQPQVPRSGSNIPVPHLGQGMVQVKPEPHQPIRNQHAMQHPIRKQDNLHHPIRELQAMQQPIMKQQAIQQPIRKQQAIQQPIRKQQAIQQPIRQQQHPISHKRQELMPIDANICYNNRNLSNDGAPMPAVNQSPAHLNYYVHNHVQQLYVPNMKF